MKKNKKEAIAAGLKTANEMYEACKTSIQTWENFMVDVRKAMSDKQDSSCITGPHNTKYYHPKVEEVFQTWLKKNAMNAGGQRTEDIKQDNQQELLEQIKQQNQKLQLEENQIIKNILQYDKVKGWYKWGDLKRAWQPLCDKLKKGSYKTIFYKAGLEYEKDYEEVVFNGCEFPTCMVSPTAVPKLISYLHNL